MKNLINMVADAAGKMTKKLLGQERMSQFNKDPNSKYACFFTCCLMYFKTVYKVKLTFDEYKRECLRAGAIRNDFWLLDHSKMAAAAGYPNLKSYNTSENIREKIYELILKGQPVIFSLSGKHYESIDGFESVDNDILFHVDDPGGQGDAFALASDLLVFKVVDGKKVYSKHPNGAKRKITTVYWFA